MTALGSSPEPFSPAAPDSLHRTPAPHPAPVPAPERRVLFVHDTLVRRVRPWVAGVQCLLTVGVSGAVRHYRLNDELRRFGRARGAMPFPFIPCTPWMALATWLLGGLLWACGAALVVMTLWPLVVDLDPDLEMIPSFASSVLLFAPFWLTTLHTARRIRTAQRLVGVDPDRLVEPIRAALIACLCPALYTWLAQRHADRVWRTWATAQPGAPLGPAHLPAATLGWNPHAWRPLP